MAGTSTQTEAPMSRLPDLVRDSKLDTEFHNECTVHVHYESNSRVPRKKLWRQVKQVGGGGFGSVWLERCQEPNLGAELRAVKRILVERQQWQNIDYIRELEAIAKFSQPRYERCFVKSFGWYQGPRTLYIAMEYFELGDLHQYLASTNKALPEQHAKEIAFQLLEGLNYMHENEFAHRDLKPGNILVKAQPPERWWVKIGDFGISKRITDSLGMPSTVKGTIQFMAPELHGLIESSDDLAPITPYAADMWSLGEVVFLMLTKQPTFRNFNFLFRYVQNQHSFPLPILEKHNVSDMGKDLILSAMLPAPEKRLTATEALQHSWVRQNLDANSNPPESRTERSILDEAPSMSSAPDLLADQFAAWTTKANPELPLEPLPEHILQPVSIPLLEPVPMPLLEPVPIPLLELVPKPPLEPLPVTSIRDSSPDSMNPKLTITLEVEQPKPPGAKAEVEHQPKYNNTFEKIVDVGKTILGRNKDKSRVVRTPENNIMDVVFSPDGKLLASGSGDGTVRLWDAATGKPQGELKGHTKAVRSVAFSPSGRLLASGSYDGTARLWDAVRQELRYELNAHLDTVMAVAFSPSARLLASASEDKTVKLWDTTTGKLRRDLRGHSGSIVAIAFSPDGILLASGSDDSTIRLWDVATGRLRRELKGHKDKVWAVAFSPHDSTLLASGSYDSKIRLWDVTTGKLRRELKGHTNTIMTVAFSPVNGALLASSSVDGTIRLWDIL